MRLWLFIIKYKQHFSVYVSDRWYSCSRVKAATIKAASPCILI